MDYENEVDYETSPRTTTDPEDLSEYETSTSSTSSSTTISKQTPAQAPTVTKTTQSPSKTTIQDEEDDFKILKVSSYLPAHPATALIPASDLASLTIVARQLQRLAPLIHRLEQQVPLLDRLDKVSTNLSSRLETLNEFQQRTEARTRRTYQASTSRNRSISPAPRRNHEERSQARSRDYASRSYHKPADVYRPKETPQRRHREPSVEFIRQDRRLPAYSPAQRPRGRSPEDDQDRRIVHELDIE